MKMNHLLLEVYCDYNKKNKDDKIACKIMNYKIGLHCLQSNCKYFSYTKCPNEIAYVNQEGVTENELCFIGFGGEMDTDNLSERVELLEKWKQTCIKKIDEAYESYMKEKENKNKK